MKPDHPTGPTLMLPENSGLEGVGVFRPALTGVVGGSVKVDGSRVTHFDWPVAQLLVAFHRDPSRGDIELTGVSARMAEDMDRLGLAEIAPFKSDRTLEGAA